MQLRIPFRRSDRRKPCTASELSDEDMIFVQGVGSDVIALQVVQMNVASGGDCFFRGANRDTTFKYFFSCLDLSDRDLVADGNVLRKNDLMSVDEVAVTLVHWSNNNEDVIVAMNAQQLLRFAFGLHQN